jgi:hypothetical protein
VKRRVLTLVAAVSLLLFAATVVLWVRGCFICDALQYSVAGEVFFAISARGGLEMGWNSNCATDGGLWHSSSADDFDSQIEHNFVGFGVTYAQYLSTMFRGVRVPDWFVCIITAGTGIGIVIRLRHKDSTHSCRTCSYSLIGNTSGICPECGTGNPFRWKPQ